MKWDEQAERLRRKAEEDAEAMRILMDASSSSDEIIGFHAQQAGEKLLKALLSHRHVAFRKTHDLTELIYLLIADGISVPPEIAEVRRLGPYATEFRYEDIPVGATKPFDPAWTAECVRKMKVWVNRLLAESGGSD